MKIRTEHRNSESSKGTDLKENVDRTDHISRHQNARQNHCYRC